MKAEDYERWVRTFDYEITKKMTSVISYRVNKIIENIQGKAPYDYIEYIQINDYQKYKEELGGQIGKEIMSQWKNHIESADAVYCETIEP